MPDITWFGWIHTIIAIVALLAGFYSLAVDKVITVEAVSGKIYLVCTLLAAVSALMIYKHGGFGPAHALAVLTLLALMGGFLVSKIALFSSIADYFQAFCFSATLLFHMIPAITDGLRRLPVDAPIVTEHGDPLLMNFYVLFLVIFVVGYIFQFRWLLKKK